MMDDCLPEGFPERYTLETLSSRSRAYELLLKEAANLVRSKEAQQQTERTTSPSSHLSPTHKRQLKDAGALLRSETAATTPPSRLRLRNGKRVVPTPCKFTRTPAAKSRKLHVTPASSSPYTPPTSPQESPEREEAREDSPLHMTQSLGSHGEQTCARHVPTLGRLERELLSLVNGPAVVEFTTQPPYANLRWRIYRQSQTTLAPPASPDLPEPAATTTASTVDSTTAEAREMDTTVASRKRGRDDEPLECPRKQQAKETTAAAPPDAEPPTARLSPETTDDSVAAPPAAHTKIVGGKRRRGQRKTCSKRRRKQREFEPSTAMALTAPRPLNSTVAAPRPPPAEEDFVTVVSKAAQRRAKALEAAAIVTDPAVVGTVLYRPSAPGGTFKGSLRLTPAAAFATRPGVVAVRINHRRNIVAADASTQPCLSELLTIKELNGIPVTARVPADRRTSIGFVHSVDGKPSDTELLEGITSTVPVVAATRQGSTVRLQFAGSLPPERVSLCGIWLRVWHAKPRPIQCRQCGRLGHVPGEGLEDLWSILDAQLAALLTDTLCLSVPAAPTGPPPLPLHHRREWFTPRRFLPSTGVSHECVLDAIDAFIDSKGMQLTPAKTEALMVHRSSIARYKVERFTLRGTTIPWSLRVKYLGVVIDHRLRCTPEVKAKCRNARRVAGAARALLARGNGWPQRASLYSLPLASLNRNNWEQLDTMHRAAIRQYYGLPRTSPRGTMLAEASDMPLSLRADVRALNHVERMQRTPHGQLLVSRLHSLEHSRMGQIAATFCALVPDTPDGNDYSVPPYRHCPLTVHTRIPGIRSKHTTPGPSRSSRQAATPPAKNQLGERGARFPPPPSRWQGEDGGEASSADGHRQSPLLSLCHTGDTGAHSSTVRAIRGEPPCARPCILCPGASLDQRRRVPVSRAHSTAVGRAMTPLTAENALGIPPTTFVGHHPVGSTDLVFFTVPGLRAPCHPDPIGTLLRGMITASLAAFPAFFLHDGVSHSPTLVSFHTQGPSNPVAYADGKDTTKPERCKALLLIALGHAGLKLFYTLNAANASASTPALDVFQGTVALFDEHFKDALCDCLACAKFQERRQLPGEPVADFITSLRSLASSCGFGALESDMSRHQLFTECSSFPLRGPKATALCFTGHANMAARLLRLGAAVNMAAPLHRGGEEAVKMATPRRRIQSFRISLKLLARRLLYFEMPGTSAELLLFARSHCVFPAFREVALPSDTMLRRWNHHKKSLRRSL
ncbi:hypothetical protein HPB52_012241 [Rhipicephalus sanguineus]|uniref:Uncharacterized protein n=1 Tax=Rhipicephalus sanguineus TaxID=34632 RepID=A0A9D4PZK7_RHISA|nr:hypothetical protein HPB52_012241 [Rhipicephalus sanguineus]